MRGFEERGERRPYLQANNEAKKIFVGVDSETRTDGHRSWNSTRLTLRSDDGYGDGNENVKQAITSNRFTLAK